MTPWLGAHVLVLRGNMDRSGVAETLRAEVIAETGALPLDPGMFKWRTMSNPLEVPLIGYCNMDNEGTTWARGWDTETAGALLAAWALSAPQPLIPTRP